LGPQAGLHYPTAHYVRDQFAVVGTGKTTACLFLDISQLHF